MVIKKWLVLGHEISEVILAQNFLDILESRSTGVLDFIASFTTLSGKQETKINEDCVEKQF